MTANSKNNKSSGRCHQPPGISATVRLIAGVLLFAAPVIISAEPPVEASLRKLEEYTPQLAAELHKLAQQSPRAKAFLSETPKTGTLKFFGELGYHALESCGWNFARCRREFPVLCKQGQIVASLRAADGRHYVIYTIAGLNAATVVPGEGFVWITTGAGIKLEDVAAHYDYDVASAAGGDILIARFEPRTTFRATSRLVFTERLRIREQKFESLKHTVEELPVVAR